MASSLETLRASKLANRTSWMHHKIVHRSEKWSKFSMAFEFPSRRISFSLNLSPFRSKPTSLWFTPHPFHPFPSLAIPVHGTPTASVPSHSPVGPSSSLVENSSTHATIWAVCAVCAVRTSSLKSPFRHARSLQCREPGMRKTGASGLLASGPPGRSSLDTEAERQGSCSLRKLARFCLSRRLSAFYTAM